MANKGADERFEDFWEATDHLWPRDEAHRKFARRVWEVATREAELAAGEKVKDACVIKAGDHAVARMPYDEGQNDDFINGSQAAAENIENALRNLSVAEILNEEK